MTTWDISGFLLFKLIVINEPPRWHIIDQYVIPVLTWNDSGLELLARMSEREIKMSLLGN